MTSVFIVISGATLLVYSAERLISSLVGISRGLLISVFLLAIVFTGITVALLIATALTSLLIKPWTKLGRTAGRS